MDLIEYIRAMDSDDLAGFVRGVEDDDDLEAAVKFSQHLRQQSNRELVRRRNR